MQVLRCLYIEDRSNRPRRLFLAKDHSGRAEFAVLSAHGNGVNFVI